jgi:predicted ester cyclase
MGAEEALVLRLITGLNSSELLDPVVDELVHQDFFSHDAPAIRASGPAGFKATVRALHRAFAGFRVDPKDVIAGDGKVVVRATASGRHVGILDGIQPTGREWSAQQIHIFRLADGKVIEHWASRDDLTVLRQPSEPLATPDHNNVEGRRQ